MSSKICRRCEHLLQDQDLVKAEIITRYVDIPSKIQYALEKPTECKWLEHKNCQFPQGDIPDEEEEAE
jgi:hypothetical protein